MTGKIEEMGIITNEGNMAKFKNFLEDLFSSGLAEKNVKKELTSYF